MSDPVEFLLARIAEDEAVARAATHPAWWYDPTKVNSVTREESVFAGSRGASAITVASTGPADDRQSMADARHIARHDPARVLAECEAKRRIVALHESWPVLIQTEPTLEMDPTLGTFRARMTSNVGWLTNAEYVKRFGTEAPTTPMLLALASVYADHPDFDPEWAG